MLLIITPHLGGLLSRLQGNHLHSHDGPTTIGGGSRSMITRIWAHGAINEDDFPSHLLCPFLMGEPLITTVTFLTYLTLMLMFPCKYSKNCLYRHIATTGIGGILEMSDIL